MKELLRRLSAHPLLAMELVLASLFANILALASPLFVSQVLNRYVASGVDATLATMTVGVTAAIVLEFGFRQARHRLAMAIGTDRDHALHVGTMGILTTAHPDGLQQWPASHRRELMRSLRTIRTAYAASNLVAILDLPFSLLYIAVLTALSFPLGMITLCFVVILFVFNTVAHRLMHRPMLRLNEVNLQKEALTHTTCAYIDTIRVFGASRATISQWQQLEQASDTLHQQMENRQGFSQGMLSAIQSLLSVAIIAMGAMLAVLGELQVGTLIGANILAARALVPILRLAPLAELMTRAQHALARLEQFAKVPVERTTGAILKQYLGGLHFRDLAKSLPPAPIPVIESLNLTLSPGAVLVVTGDDGASQTVLARLIAGLTYPDRGQILADGVDLRQLDPNWWRRQLVYLPRDPEFLDGSLRDNITSYNAKISLANLNEFITDAGLSGWVDETPQGLDTPLVDGGKNLAPGLRKRIALARALATGGKLVVFDEPTENMDPKGIFRIYSVLHKLSQQGSTIVVITNDPNILRGASLVLDMNTKPKPTLIDRLSPSPVPVAS